MKLRMRKKEIIPSYIIILLFIISSCAVDTTELHVEQNAFDIPASGEWLRVHIDVNNEWNAESDAEWCTVTPSYGNKSDNTINVYVSGNRAYEDRNCTITISSKEKSETIQIRQRQSDVIFVEDRNINISDVEQTFTIDVDANVEYEVIIDQSWLKLVSTKSISSRTLSFQAEANTAIENRSATIFLAQKGGNFIRTITVTQKQKDVLVSSVNEISFGWKETNEFVNVLSNVDYRIEISDNVDWIIVNREQKGKENGLNINVREFVPSPNTMSPYRLSDRKCSIKLLYENMAQVINVEQKFKDLIWIQSKEINAYLNYEKSLVSYAYLHDGIDKSLKYSISNPKIASINSGRIIPKTIGQATINVSNADDTYSATCQLYVKNIADDIFVNAHGLRMNEWNGKIEMVFHSNIHYPSILRSIKYGSVLLCQPNGAIYDIQSTRDGYVQFDPIVIKGAFSSSMNEYYSRWFVVYSVEIDGEVRNISTNLNPYHWSSSKP